ncbi:glycine oxidase ThiO [Thiolapillus sp.]
MSDVLIIGAGVIGMLTARELRIAGAEVTLLERGELARESSWAGGGIISPLYPWRYPDSISQMARASQQLYATLCDELHGSTGIDPEYTVSGLLIQNQDELDPARHWASRYGQRMSVVNNSAITELEPERENPPGQALWLPDIAQVRNPRLLQALAEDLQQRGVHIKTQTPATGLALGDGHMQGIHTPDGLVSADITVLAMGAWTGAFSRMLPSPVDIRPVRGQMLLFKGQPDVIHHMMLEENRYIIPRKDGRILFGSTLEETGFDNSVTKTTRRELGQLAIGRYPVLKDFPVERHWAGLRPAAPAGIPYIARHPQIENLFINAGHFRNGVVLGPASARLLADLLLKREPALDPTPYALNAPRG